MSELYSQEDEGGVCVVEEKSTSSKASVSTLKPERSESLSWVVCGAVMEGSLELGCVWRSDVGVRHDWVLDGKSSRAATAKD